MKAVLQEAVSLFQLGDLLSESRVGGFAHKNYRVTTTSGQYIIKCGKSPYGAADKELEAQFLTLMRAAGLPVISYLTSQEGRVSVSIDDWLVQAQELSPGEEGSPSLALISDVGRFLAKLHSMNPAGASSKKHWLDAAYMAESEALLKEHFSQHPIQDILAIARRTENRSGPYGIIHGDLTPDNVLVKDSKLLAVLDWEEVGVAPCIIDLAMTIHSWCFDQDSFRADYYQQLIQSYNEHRALDREELERLQQAFVHTGAVLALWRFLQHNHYQPEEPKKQRHMAFWKQKIDSLILPPLQ